MKKLNNSYLPIVTHYIDVPYDNKKRRVRVLLPKNYDKEKSKSYPVLYMHDGQNIFYSRESYSGHSWKIIPLIKNHDMLPKMIIVAIDNSSEDRIDEYTPWQLNPEELDRTNHVGGYGIEYGEWVVNTIKPFIDEQYRTKTDRRDTLLAGSSLGGLITAYMGAAYPNVFGSLGVFSLASWVNEEPFLNYIKEHPLDSNTKVYIQVGTEEGNKVDSTLSSKNINQAYIDSSLWYYQTLLETGHPLNHHWLRILANEHHFEKYWADHFGEFLTFSFNDYID